MKRGLETFLYAGVIGSDTLSKKEIFKGDISNLKRSWNFEKLKILTNFVKTAALAIALERQTSVLYLFMDIRYTCCKAANFSSGMGSWI